MTQLKCVFCNIVDGKEVATVLYEDNEIIAFNNLLDWVPVMILVIPKRHLTQTELWTDTIGSKVSKVAVSLGEKYCPNGFRLLCNFRKDAMQSQSHGHLHVLGGTYLGPYV